MIPTKKYHSENLNEIDEKTFDPNQFKIIKKEFEEKTKTEMQKPIWFEINKKEFEELT